MDDFEFGRIIGDVNLHDPSEVQLWHIFDEELALLSPTMKETRRVRRAFGISFWGHREAPRRASGEAYFFHVVRAALRSIGRQCTLKIKDIELIIDILLHDSFEDARKSGISPLLMHSKVRFLMGSDTSLDVYYLTKQKQLGETNDQAFIRLTESVRWRPIVGKLEDRTDNIITISSMPEESQASKIAETEKWLPVLVECGAKLIGEEVKSGRLHPNFHFLIPSICKELVPVLWAQKKRLNMR